MRVLLVGRFQPFHFGHLKLLKQAEKIGDVIIALGSANESGTQKNPMTASERRECIERVLSDKNFEAEFVELPDFHDNDKWTDYLLSKISDFDVAISGNELVRRLLRDRGYDAREPEFLRDTWKYNGTYVRETIAKGGDYESLVPEAVAKFLKEQKIIERIQSLR